jgi:hypothetical protein
MQDRGQTYILHVLRLAEVRLRHARYRFDPYLASCFVAQCNKKV